MLVVYTLCVMPIHITANYKRAFKDADIRGVYPSEIDEELVYLVARSFIDEYGYKDMVVGRDMRLSTPALFDAFKKGVTDAGATVIDIGLVSTPMVYYASGTWELPAVMITASHSPRDYNGLKLVLPGAIPLTEAHGLKAVRTRLEKGVFKEVEKKGKVRQKSVLRGYQRFVLRGFRTADFKAMKIVADCGNGMSNVALPLVAEKIPVTFTSLFTELDGRFPNRDSDPTLKRNQRAIAKKLKEGGFDFGISFDGDADRVAFFDEKGTYINSAIIGALIAKRLLKTTPGARLTYTNLTSRVYEESIRYYGGKPVPARVGHAFIKETMRKKDVLFACEHSGHFYFKDYFYTDSVMRTLLTVMVEYAEAKKRGESFSTMMMPFQRYAQTEDVIVPVENQKQALEKVRVWLEKKQPKQLKKFDGYYVDFGDVWGAVKVSVTEPALKMMFEGKKRNAAEALQTEVVAYVKTLAKR
jgi:phosphomannomutase